MTVPEIDSARIFSAILASGVTNPVAIEKGSELVDHWASECQIEDQKYRTLGLELGWFIELAPQTYCVGACDKVAWEPGGEDESPFVFEAKTSAGGTKTWNAGRWFDELRAGHQVAIYAAALKWGTFIHEDGERQYAVVSPRVLARAVTKSCPPQVWPTPAGGWINFTLARLHAAISACRNVMVSIRAQRRTNVVPWQLPGKHCVRQYGYKEYKCAHWTTCHDTLAYPTANGTVIGLSPGSASVVDHLVATGRIQPDDPNVVILSSTSLGHYAQCPELWRQNSIVAEEEKSEALETGSVFHAGIAEYYRQCKDLGL